MKKYRRPMEELIEKEVAKRFELQPKTANHKFFVELMNSCTLTICSGAAGTGKSSLTIQYCFQQLRKNTFKKIVLFRPLEDCGPKSMGALPGDKDEKIAPYMAAYTEIFAKLANESEIRKWYIEGRLSVDVIEYARGRTFDDSIIVLDEAQNCTYSQIKMILTRIGKNSKVIVLGDETQTDLNQKFWKDGQVPFTYIVNRIDTIDDDAIGIVELDENDIVRNGLITKLLKAI